ncbi:MAG: ATP-binding protein, partial [Propionibacteriaceae bacterium]|nr:ATP-binding protein [Propionibacteriaceae bacterium]
ALGLMAGEDGQVVGIGGGDQRHHQTLGDMVSTPQYAPSVGQADWAQAPVNATETRRVLALGLRLFRFDGRPVAVLQRRMSRMHGNGQGVLEVLCPDADVANALIERATALATEHSVLRGNVISLEMQGFEAEGDGYRFLPRPDVAADQVILPDGVLDRITGHVTGIARHAEVLRRHGQHLKRGVLLYGPPGTGKTHTVRHLIGAATGHTVILLSGETLALIGPATAIARHLQPAIVVLEDCDLVAMERDYMGGMRPLLFQLLDALDGLDADADISFLLTTNRVDVLEEALTQRPGRVDLAVEIPPPGPRERRRLLELYRGDIGYSDAVLHEVAGRSDAHTASFFKELMRRAVLLAAEEGEEPADQHLLGALASLQADQDRLSHSLLGGLGGDLDGFVE